MISNKESVIFSNWVTYSNGKYFHNNIFAHLSFKLNIASNGENWTMIQLPKKPSLAQEIVTSNGIVLIADTDAWIKTTSAIPTGTLVIDTIIMF